MMNINTSTIVAIPTSKESAWERLVKAAQRIKVYTNDPKFVH